MLSGPEIIRQRELGNITIEPFTVEQVNPNSYNVRLGDKLRVYRDTVLDVRRQPETEEIEIPERGVVLPVGIGHLGATVEVVGSEKFVPVLNGRSSIGRLFLLVHATAGFGDTSFLGSFTLELIAMDKPVRIYPGMQIAQIAFEQVQGELRGYKGKYQGQTGPVESRLWMEGKR